MTHSSDSNNRAATRAIALQYKDLSELPRVTASGLGAVARQIIEIAQANQIPVQSEGELAELLMQAKPGSRQKMSEQTLELIAEVLAYLYYVDQQWRESHRFLDAVLAKEPEY